MSQRFRFVPASFAASALLLVASVSSALQAPPNDPVSCGDGPACAYGFECAVVGSSGCAPAACAPGASCPEPEPCAVTNEYACMPAHCQVNQDCAAGMVCHEYAEACAVTDCACPPDAPDCGCGTTTCDPKTVSMCTPVYLLPCDTATDCGAGFTCQAQESCSCGGSAGAPTPGAAPEPAGGQPPMDAAAPIPPDCQCEPAPNRCIPNEIACQTDANCPAGWSCEQSDVASRPACSGGGDCADLPAPEMAPPHCVPAYYGGGRDYEEPGVPVSGGDKNESGSGTGAPGGDSKPPTNATDDGSAEAHESSACQFGRAPLGSGAFGALAVLGALVGLKRRRAQR
jgi:hypothetical protein